MFAFPLFFFLPIFKSLDHVVCYGFAAFGMQCLIAVLNEILDKSHSVQPPSHFRWRYAHFLCRGFDGQHSKGKAVEFWATF